MSVNKFTKGLSADEKAEIQEKFIEVIKNNRTRKKLVCIKIKVKNLQLHFF